MYVEVEELTYGTPFPSISKHVVGYMITPNNLHRLTSYLAPVQESSKMMRTELQLI